MAAAASAHPSEMECPVCNEIFTTPKILPCAHILCRQCLVTWLKSETECPLCLCPIAKPEKRAPRSLNEIADSFPTDTAMEVVIECSEILKTKHSCCGCKSMATYTCLTCGDMLCCSCSVIHKSMSMLREHEVETLATLTPERLAVRRRSLCTAHPNTPSEIFCPTHGMAVCYQCAILEHRGCSEVIQLKENAEAAHKVLEELVSILKDGESKLDGAISELDQYLEHMEARTQAALADIDRDFDHLKTCLEACQRRLKNLMRKAYADTKSEVNGAKTCLKHRRGRMTSHRLLVERVRGSMSRTCACGDLATNLRVRVNGIDFKVTLPGNLKVVTMASLKIEEKMVNGICQKLSQLGSIEVFAAPVSAQPSSWQFHQNHGNNIVLSNDQRTAERKEEPDDAIVVSADHMITGRLYEVCVMSRDNRQGSCLLCGVTLEDPAKLTLPSKAIGWKAAVLALQQFPVGTQKSEARMKVLQDVPVGRRVGVTIDSHSCLHLYVDGVDYGVIARVTKRPCYALFELGTSYKKVKTVGLTTSR